MTPLFRRKPKNPELESKRQVPGPEDPIDDVTELQERTANVHAAFLFHVIGNGARNKLCLLDSSTRNSYDGWKMLGHHLGLNDLLIRCIENHFHNDVPTYYVLLAFAQRKDSTLYRIVDALYKMKRYDAITLTKQLLIDLADAVLANEDILDNRTGDGSGDESGYDSLSVSTLDSDINRHNIIRPPEPPLAPSIFKEYQGGLSNEGWNGSNSIEVESVQTAVPIMKKRSDKKQIGCTVLLTFASDGLHTAKQVAAVFRKQRENLPRIGVVMLEEQSEYVNSCPGEFITGAFDQVDYVVPIITEGYLRTVTSHSQVAQSAMECLDAKFVKYIYTLMTNYYMQNGCINDKIRCIVPDNKVLLTQRHPAMVGPMLQVWVRESETEQLCHRILNSRFQPKF